MQASQCVFLLIFCACSTAQPSAKPAELMTVRRSEVPEPLRQELVKLAPAELRGQIAVDRPPHQGYWFKAVVQECLLEATTVEITIRDSAGNIVHDITRTGVLKTENSTQSEWLELISEPGKYILDNVVFRSALGEIIYATSNDLMGVPATTFALDSMQPVYAYIVVIDCEKLKRQLEH